MQNEDIVANISTGSDKKRSTRDAIEDNSLGSDKNILPNPNVTDDANAMDALARQNSLDMYEEVLAEGFRNVGIGNTRALPATFDLSSDLEKIQCGKYYGILRCNGYDEEVRKYMIQVAHL